MKYLSSRDNPTVRILQTLATSSRARRDSGRTLLDGVHLVESWLQHIGLPIHLVVAESAQHKAEIARLIAQVEQHQPESILLLSDSAFNFVSPVDSPIGVLAEVAIPQHSMPRPLGDCVVLEAIQDAGNLGTILRACAAVGVQDVLLTPGCVQAWSPKVLRAGQGAHCALRLHEGVDVAAALANYEQAGGQILATRLDATQSLYAANLQKPCAWLFGNEGAGLSDALAQCATNSILIPMPGQSESLNVAMAATVCLFEQARQRIGRA